MTNIGIIYPDPGYHDALREITKLTGILLIIDETHTICTSPGVYTQAYNLKADFLALGKPIAGEVPAAVYCFTQEIADRFQSKLNNF
jgi:glutamate-1-semialdehyde 2,1-aminomutase